MNVRVPGCLHLGKRRRPPGSLCTALGRAVTQRRKTSSAASWDIAAEHLQHVLLAGYQSYHMLLAAFYCKITPSA